MTQPVFELSDVEDVRILIKVIGKHYSITPIIDKDEAKEIRIGILKLLLEFHAIDTPLEELKSKL
jgi:hypothetical protein